MPNNDLILVLLKAAAVNAEAAVHAVQAAAALYESGALEPAPPDPAAPCHHPQDHRTSIGTLADPGAYLCRACGHIEQKEPANG